MSTDEYDLTITDSARTPGRRLNNLTAIIPPTVNDDWNGASGYEVGSVWVDTATDTFYVCVDSTNGAAVWSSGGGGDTSLEVDTSVSGSYTADRNLAATFDLTLTGNTTITPDHSDPPAGRAIDLRLIIRQDGTGGRTLAWGGTIDWATGSAPTMPTAANAILTVGLLSVDDAVSWLGYAVLTDVVVALDDLTDVVITAPALNEQLIYDGANWVNDTPTTVSALNDLTDVVITSATENDDLVFTGTVWEDRPAGRHDHVVGEAAVGDGASTVFYLAQEAEPDTVAAYAAGLRVAITQDTSQLDRITFTAAPGAAAAIVYDYIPLTS
jgi:hypothetical protein